MTRLLPLRTGWDPDPAESWYPADLPEDWRLAYFANVAWAVLVPARQWLAPEPMPAGSWATETPERFRFYLERDGSEGAEGPWCGSRLDLLGDRLGGLVETAGCGGSELRRVLHPRSGASQSLAREVPVSAVSDIRAARRWIERAVAEASGRPVLALLGPCRFGDLEGWQTLSELMGFS